MVVLGGWAFLMSELPLQLQAPVAIDNPVESPLRGLIRVVRADARLPGGAAAMRRQLHSRIACAAPRRAVRRISAHVCAGT